MATKDIAILVKMTIELPEGDTEITQQEQDNICAKIFESIKENGVTSDEYEGHLAGEFIKGDYIPQLEVDVVPNTFDVKVNVNVRGDKHEFSATFSTDSVMHKLPSID